MAVSSQYQRTQQTGALAILFGLLSALAIAIVLLAVVAIPDTVSTNEPVPHVANYDYPE